MHNPCEYRVVVVIYLMCAVFQFTNPTLCFLDQKMPLYRHEQSIQFCGLNVILFADESKCTLGAALVLFRKRSL